jgi:hypothetical protein
MPEKKIQPKAADTESTAKKTAAAGVEKKSQRHMKRTLHKAAGPRG